MLALGLIPSILLTAAVFTFCTRKFIRTEEILKADQRHPIVKTLRFLVILTVLAMVVALLFNCLLLISIVPSESMESTIMTGDIVISTRYDTDQIERYDIIVFYAPDDPDTNYIKRVIGLPGETITICDGKVYADGVELRDDFTLEGTASASEGTYVVPDGCYFMLGDNRNNSFDSRYWQNKYVKQEDIIGKAVCVVLPFTDIKWLRQGGGS